MFERQHGGQGLVVSAAVALLAAALPLAASAKPGEVHHRVSHEQQRIQSGLKSGQITQGEYNRDERRLQAINAQRKADLQANGGHLTAAERQQLNHELNHSSRDIYWSKHNGMTQAGVTPHDRQGWGGKLPPVGSAGYVGARLNQEEARIHDGALNGSLTQHEYNVDMRDLKGIEAQRNAWLKAQNGTLTASQQAQLTSELNAESQRIYGTKHNSTDQPGY
jgi:hypothetical protein